MSPSHEPSLRGRRILVTGSSGFIGSNAVAHFQARGAEVRGLDIVPPRNPALADVVQRGDICDAGTVRRIVTDFSPEYVVHLAARTDLLEKRSIGGYRANIEGVERVLEAVEGQPGVRRLLVTSSRMVCRIGYVPSDEEDYCPPNLYGESKVRTEQIVRNGRLAVPWVMTRPTSIWGEWFAIPYRNFFDTIARRQYRHPGSADPRKSFGYVGNFVYQLERLLVTEDEGVLGRTIYQCDTPPLNLRAWADLIRREWSLPPVPSVPVTVLRIAAAVGDAAETLGMRNAPLTSFRLDNLLTDMVYPTDPIERICGPLPFSLAEGVRRTVAWMRATE